MTFPTRTPSIAAPAACPVIREVIVNGERLIELGACTLVASESQPGGWYEIRNDSCPCKGFQYRGICRHAIAVMARKLQVAEEVASDLAAIVAALCPACHEPTADVLHCEYAACPSNAGPARKPVVYPLCTPKPEWLEPTPESRVPTGKAALALCSLADD